MSKLILGTAIEEDAMNPSPQLIKPNLYLRLNFLPVYRLGFDDDRHNETYRTSFRHCVGSALNG
jgi:hypothetical protein